MSTFSLHTADALARTLAKREVDPNEVAKCFTHLRDYLEAAGNDQQGQQQAADQWWTWLETVAGPAARTVVRSNRTRSYYVDLLDACQLHLANLDPAALSHALGWAVRLMRYYRNVQGALAQPTSFTPAPAPVRRQPAPPRKPEHPEPGQRFNNIRVVEVSDAGFFVELKLPEELNVIAAIRAGDADGKRYGRGAHLNAEVIEVKPRKGGGFIVYLRPVPGKAKEPPR
jgi:hypothetical protein